MVESRGPVLQQAEAALEDVAAFIERGTPAFLRTNLALFAAGFATFALIYCVQPLMPVFSTVFGVGAAESSLSLSLTTGLLAVSMLGASAVSEAWGRKRLMVASVLASSVLTLVASLVPHWSELLLARALTGVAVSGLPAIAMAYVAEEMHPKSVGLAMGLYIGGSGLGGMAGRLLTGVITDFYGWRPAMFAIGAVAFVSGLVFWRSLPPSRHFQPRPLALLPLLRAFTLHLRDRALPLLFAEGFLVMGAFVSVYNYIGYRLLQPPFGLSQAAVGMIFSVYLVGIFSSAWMGDLAGRLGRRRVLWSGFAIMLAGVGLTLSSHLAVIVAGIALVTFGFFGGHSIASSWVGARTRQAKAQAASLYLFAYYMGSSLAGSAGGVFWTRYGWPGVVGMDIGLLLLGLGIALWLTGVPPRPEGEKG
ncbi:MAG: MFS transporter [Janthinobacterium lividum]